MQTVLSKAAWALLLAPLIAIVIGVLVGLALWLIAIVGASIAGVPSPGPWPPIRTRSRCCGCC